MLIDYNYIRNFISQLIFLHFTKLHVGNIDYINSNFGDLLA